ncbi:MAG TPA: hypothetical protein PLO71_07830, partial [Thauera phenylacetica]|nr:hypothetical protein [Thauera phenylacetica]
MAAKTPMSTAPDPAPPAQLDAATAAAPPAETSVSPAPQASDRPALETGESPPPDASDSRTPEASESPTPEASSPPTAAGIAARGRAADAWLLETCRLTWRVKLHLHLTVDLFGQARAAAEDEAIRI